MLLKAYGGKIQNESPWINYIMFSVVHQCKLMLISTFKEGTTGHENHAELRRKKKIYLHQTWAKIWAVQPHSDWQLHSASRYACKFGQRNNFAVQVQRDPSKAFLLKEGRTEGSMQEIWQHTRYIYTHECWQQKSTCQFGNSFFFDRRAHLHIRTEKDKCISHESFFGARTRWKRMTLVMQEIARFAFCKIQISPPPLHSSPLKWQSLKTITANRYKLSICYFDLEFQVCSCILQPLI